MAHRVAKLDHIDLLISSDSQAYLCHSRYIVGGRSMGCFTYLPMMYNYSAPKYWRARVSTLKGHSPCNFKFATSTNLHGQPSEVRPHGR